MKEKIVKQPKVKAKPKPKPIIENIPMQGTEIVIDPDEEILLEGEMLKFKPGFEKNFIARWI